MSSNASNVIQEGQAKVSMLPGDVFYNPVQEFNRDMTVAIIQEYAKIHREEWHTKMNKKLEANKEFIVPSYPRLRILDALSATGLRSVRFALEIPRENLDKIIANDFDMEAHKLIQSNAINNHVDDIIEAECEDAVMLMMKNRSQIKSMFHVIDIDPYGSAAPFLDSAVQALYDGGLLCVTCTDTAVLCGSAEGTSFGRYGSVAVRCQSVHEQALRILLHAIQSAGSVHGKVIEPLLSISIDFYLRVFVRVRTAPGEVKAIASKMANIYVCVGCQNYHLQPLAVVEPTEKGRRILPARGPPVGPKCDNCGNAFVIGGPIWASRIHNQTFLNRLIASLQEKQSMRDKKETSDQESAFTTFKTLDRMIGICSLLREELPDTPLHYKMDMLTKTIRCIVPPMVKFRSAILNAGYEVSLSHSCLNSLKTNAPHHVLWDILRCWTKEPDCIPINSRHLEDPNGIIRRILDQEPKFKADFSTHSLANPPSRMEKLLRFPPNPAPDWGPKARPSMKRAIDSDSTELLNKKINISGDDSAS